jgi:hypothetical protein
MAQAKAKIPTGAAGIKELTELSKLIGTTDETQRKVFADGKFNLKDDLTHLIGLVFGAVTGIEGAGDALKTELPDATVAQLQTVKAAYAAELTTANAHTKYTHGEIFSGLICLVQEIKNAGKAEGITEGRKAILKELKEGANLDLLYAAEVA